MAKQWTDEERAAFAVKMKAAREKAKQTKDSGVFEEKVADEDFDKTDFQEDPNQELIKQIKELQETQALLKAALLNQPQQQGGVTREGNLVGEVDKYVVDPHNYEDPTKRLSQEPRLANIAFNHNYELEYSMDVVGYQNAAGIRMREPKFHVTLNRVMLDDDGNQTDKRYIARKLIFHEDTQAAMIVARENGLEIDKTNEKQFLNDMRYLRVRDWLFGFLWPKPATTQGQVHEEVIGNTLVQVFTKASVDPSEIPFDQLKNKAA